MTGGGGTLREENASPVGSDVGRKDKSSGTVGSDRGPDYSFPVNHPLVNVPRVSDRKDVRVLH